MHAQVKLVSSNPRLVEGFGWAKAQALAYVFEGDPVGDWYEAALPGREAFCMRDVAHQSTGAQALGLRRHTHNMLHKFATGIAASRDWCSFWEIDRYDRPCPVDYTNDADFWYNLPANFDVLNCCYRQYLWTGDRRFLDDQTFRNFYARTVFDYVRSWDRDGDGIPEHHAVFGRRGIASYNEAVDRPLIGADLIAAQYAAYVGYANILQLAGDKESPELWRALAANLRAHFDQEWWSASHHRFASIRRYNHQLDMRFGGITNFFPLYFELLEDRRKIEATLDDVIAHRRSMGIEDRSYLPEILYAYGRPSVAYAELVEQLNPTYPRRDYPEVSFAIIGAFVTGMMGIAPNATSRTVATLAQPDESTEWIELVSLPVFDNIVSVWHAGCTQSRLTNQSGPLLQWTACFAGHVPALSVDGKPVEAQWGSTERGQPISWTSVSVDTGCQVVVSVRG